MRRCLILAAIAGSLSTGAAALSATKSQAARTSGTSDEPEDPPEPPSFARDVMPTLGRYCENCHGMREQHGGLRLDNYDNLMRGGDSGPAVVAGDASKSLLVAKIEHRDRPSMPPRKWLPKAAIARIRAWIAAGAQP
jgi:hypothetical protein